MDFDRLLADLATGFDPRIVFPSKIHRRAHEAITDLRRQLAEAKAEVERLKTAITVHATQKADDRCWLDDIGLYSAAGVSHLADNRVGDKAAMMVNCARFIERRCAGGQWPTYAELESQLAACRAAIRGLLDAISRTTIPCPNFPDDIDAKCDAARALVPDPAKVTG